MMTATDALTITEKLAALTQELQDALAEAGLEWDSKLVTDARYPLGSAYLCAEEYRDHPDSWTWRRTGQASVVCRTGKQRTFKEVKATGHVDIAKVVAHVKQIIITDHEVQAVARAANELRKAAVDEIKQVQKTLALELPDVDITRVAKADYDGTVSLTFAVPSGKLAAVVVALLNAGVAFPKTEGGA